LLEKVKREKNRGAKTRVRRTSIPPNAAKKRNIQELVVNARGGGGGMGGGAKVTPGQSESGIRGNVKERAGTEARPKLKG